MTVVLDNYSVEHFRRQSLSKPQVRAEPQQFYPSQELGEQDPWLFGIPDFDLDLSDLGLGLTLDIGGLNLENPNLSSSPLSAAPLTPPPDSAADLCMSQDGQRSFFGSSGRAPFRLPFPDSRLGPAQDLPLTARQSALARGDMQSAGSFAQPLDQAFYARQVANMSPFIGHGTGRLGSENASSAPLLRQPRPSSCYDAFSSADSVSPTATPVADVEEPRQRWRPGQSWPSTASPGVPYSPSPLRLSQLHTDSFDSQASMFTAQKLSRTVSDAYADELFSPEFTLTTSSQSPGFSSPRVKTEPSNDVFSQRVRAANRLPESPVAASAVGGLSRDRSPFKRGAPLAPTTTREFAFDDLGLEHGSDTPATISPRDALLELPEPGEGADRFSLFPALHANTDEAMADYLGVVGIDKLNAPSLASFSPRIKSPMSISAPKFPLTARGAESGSPVSPDMLLDRQQYSASDSDEGLFLADPTVPMPKPFKTSADEGTYSCTYHGCTLRFESPAQLQRHKRDGHRQAHGLNSLRARQLDVGSSIGFTVADSQAGPHRCDRINPSTNKPCGVVFSRPYDLTRHEDTIHNARKTKSRCDYCTEEKTFSRADALTRHYRVCHPEVEVKQKHRRRFNGSTSSV